MFISFIAEEWQEKLRVRVVEQKKRIIIGRTPPPYGGVSIYNQNLIQALKQRKIDFEVIIPSLFSFYNLKKKYFDSFNSIVENPSFKNIIRYFPFLIFRKDVIKVIHAGDIELKYPDLSKLQLYLIKKYLKNCQEVICVSSELQLFISSIFQIKTKVIPSLLPYFNEPVTESIKESIFKIRQTNSFIILGIGVFNEFYGFKHIIDAISPFAIAQKIHLVLIDGGFVKDQEYYESCLNGNNFITVFEKIPSGDTQWIMRNSDLFVRSVQKESFGLSKIEATLNDTHVVCTNTGYTEDIVTYEFGDVDKLKTLILSHLYNRTELDKKIQLKIRNEMSSNLNNFLSYFD